MAVPYISGSISQTATGRPTDIIQLFPQNNPFNATVTVSISGSATYTLQHTLDNPNASGFTAAGATWLNHDATGFVTSTTGGTTNYAFPVLALSVNVTSGTGTVTVKAVQAGPQP